MISSHEGPGRQKTSGPQYAPRCDPSNAPGQKLSDGKACSPHTAPAWTKTCWAFKRRLSQLVYDSGIPGLQAEAPKWGAAGASGTLSLGLSLVYDSGIPGFQAEARKWGAAGPREPRAWGSRLRFGDTGTPSRILEMGSCRGLGNPEPGALPARLRFGDTGTLGRTPENGELPGPREP